MGVESNILSVPKFDNLEIVRSGKIALPSLSVANPGASKFAAGEATETINHNLGFIPIAFVSQNTLNVGYPLPSHSYFGSNDTAYWLTYQFWVTETQLIVAADCMVRGLAFSIDNSAIDVTYYLCRVKVNPV